jgi:hypothetical protein
MTREDAIGFVAARKADITAIHERVRESLERKTHVVG